MGTVRYGNRRQRGCPRVLWVYFAGCRAWLQGIVFRDGSFWPVRLTVSVIDIYLGFEIRSCSLFQGAIIYGAHARMNVPVFQFRQCNSARSSSSVHQPQRIIVSSDNSTYLFPDPCVVFAIICCWKQTVRDYFLQTELDAISSAMQVVMMWLSTQPRRPIDYCKERRTIEKYCVNVLVETN